MANPFAKFWNYLMALFDNKIEENADPKVQIEQAIGEAQRQHQALSQQAAAVIGNQRQIEMQLNRRLEEVEKLQANTKQALQLADKAREGGDARRPRSTRMRPRPSPRSWSPRSRASRKRSSCTTRRCSRPRRPSRPSSATRLTCSSRWRSAPSCCPSWSRRRCRRRSRRPCSP